jgi:thioredoxin reductase (NADPH)
MRNGRPYTFIDLELDPDVQNLLDSFHITASEISVVICRGKVVLRNPNNQEIADGLGFNEAIDQTQARDLVIIGAGPSGLAAAVYGASEGLDVLMAGNELAGRPDGFKLKNRKLFGISQRYLWSGARSSGVPPGTEVRRGDAHHQGHQTRLRQQPYVVEVENGARIPGTHCCDCNRGGVSKTIIEKLVTL